MIYYLNRIGIDYALHYSGAFLKYRILYVWGKKIATTAVFKKEVVVIVLMLSVYFLLCAH